MLQRRERGIQLEIRSDKKTVVDWINSQARQRSKGGAVEHVQKTVGRIEEQASRLGGSHFS